MNINRKNYEEYFLLYTDNELSAADKQAVEFFIQQNPDLEKEFIMLQQSTFSADDTIVFPNKEVLMHEPVHDGLIHHENYLEMFILYSDEELTADEKTTVEKFVYQHPQYQEEFELIHSVKLIPDLNVTFPDKNKLYHSQPAHAAKPGVFNWTRVAVAAAVLIFAGVLWLAKPGSDISKEVVKSDIRPALRISRKSLAPEIRVTSPADHAKIPPGVPKAVSEKQRLAFIRENVAPRKNLASNSIPRRSVQNRIQKDETGIAPSGNKALAAKSSPVTNQVQPENSKTAEPGIVDGTIAAQPANPRVSQPDATAKPVVVHALVQNQANDEKDNIILASNDDHDAITIAGIPVDKKGSIRGIFRKASRFIDKTSSIRPGKKQGLVIGNIEIAFQ